MVKAIHVHTIHPDAGPQTRYYRSPTARIEINGVMICRITEEDKSLLKVEVAADIDEDGIEEYYRPPVFVAVPSITEQPKGIGSRVRTYYGTDAAREAIYIKTGNDTWMREPGQDNSSSNIQLRWRDLTPIEVLQDTSVPKPPPPDAEPKGVGAIARAYCNECDSRTLMQRSFEGEWQCRCRANHLWRELLELSKPEVINEGVNEE